VTCSVSPPIVFSSFEYGAADSSRIAVNPLMAFQAGSPVDERSTKPQRISFITLQSGIARMTAVQWGFVVVGSFRLGPPYCACGQMRARDRIVAHFVLCKPEVSVEPIE
jgi:hypothetical protein